MNVKCKHEYLPLSACTLLVFQQALLYTIAVFAQGLIFLENLSIFCSVGDESDDTTTLGMAERVHFLLYHIKKGC
jgi:hypothetical protein